MGAVSATLDAAKELSFALPIAKSAGEIYALALLTAVSRHIYEAFTEENSAFVSQIITSLRAKSPDFSQVISSVKHSYNMAENLTDEDVVRELILLRENTLNLGAENIRELYASPEISGLTEFYECMASVIATVTLDEVKSKDEKSIKKIFIKGDNLYTVLRKPWENAPNSLSGQLQYFYDLSPELFDFALLALDTIREENKPIFFGPGPAIVYDYVKIREETEQFSDDSYWMPNVVMMAKNIFVWLFQLSKKYGREINTLDEIPDEELLCLQENGFTALWLIGLWQRSPASKKIKQYSGSYDAVSSAYAVYDYVIASELGGDDALLNLKERAKKYGIRLASDMVPNHMGLDSPWVIEHPEWFISRDTPPFFSYTYNGANLSTDERVALYIEDHYYDKNDAAVTFKWVSRASGECKYIYHGNDGTCMPWNDTAQLNYLKAEVREKVIRMIVDVAKRFPIIRFDAAMTLAKEHVARLWYPQPGTGGDIPSRSECAISAKEFDALFPKEFWREVVDVIAVEAPDTLLLAEAFWMLEGFFVRTLGMHRVYNSAFMNMLRDEDNSGYRNTIKNTISFDPEILQRFVNFLSNPDEKTAIEQFSDGDKYLGVLTLAVTMPGLPMFGHGQLEGFTEKYGMDYYRPYYDEKSSEHLEYAHKEYIFPLLKLRKIFAEVENFRLYDFFEGDYVNEDVFAYSNCNEGIRSLIIYNNRYRKTSGNIKLSVSFLDKESRVSRQESLADALMLSAESDKFLLYRDMIAGLEYIHPISKIIRDGLSFELNAYERKVFLDFEIAEDDEEGSFVKIAEELQGTGVKSVRNTVKKEKYAHFLKDIYAAIDLKISDNEKVLAAAVKISEIGDYDLDFYAEAVSEYLGKAQAKPVSKLSLWLLKNKAEIISDDITLADIVSCEYFMIALGVNEYNGTLWYRQEFFENVREYLRIFFKEVFAERDFDIYTVLREADKYAEYDYGKIKEFVGNKE